MHIPYSDDINAAPDQATAEIMAEKHNAAMAKWLRGKHEKGEFCDLELGDLKAFAVSAESQGVSPEDHAKMLDGFDLSKWVK